MKVEQEDIKPEELNKKVKKAKTPKKPREKKDIRSVFRKYLSTLDIEKLKKPWMATKAFRNITTKDELWAWARGVVEDKTRYHLNPIAKVEMPVVAVDTETIGLDTRIITIIKENPDGTLSLSYDVNIELAGVCLSADGVEGIYVPIHHEKGSWIPAVYELSDPSDPNSERIEVKPGYWTEAVNISREDVAEVLQWLFDQCHLVFYNAKFDREVIRICLGITLRGYPYFEDVQVIQYVNDPKHDFGDKGRGTFTGDSGGLKALSENILGIEQIKGEELMKIKADFCPNGDAFKCGCNDSNRKKHTTRVVYVPFTWVPTDIALWYAAGDAICTWLLWFQQKDKARERALVHRIDHELVESLTFLERQRFLVDVFKHGRTVNWHARKLAEMEGKLRQLAIEGGFEEECQEDGTVLEDDRFNPNSNPQLSKLFFKVKGFKVIRVTDAGNPSCDAEVVADLIKMYPEDEFLKLFAKYKEYVALHPENLRYDPRDNSARIYLKQNVVAGGRLAAAGGDYPVDGGFGLNPQGIKRVEGNWWVRGNILEPDFVKEEDIEEYTEADLHKSCFKDVEEEYVVEEHDEQEVDWETQKPLLNRFGEAVMKHVVTKAKRKVHKKAPGIIKNHIGNYLGYSICLVPKCTSCAEKHGILIPKARMDANEVVNIRSLMIAVKGWTFYTIDYSNIEMRAAANCSGEPEFIKEFLEGKGDFHSLTASKVFPEFTDPSTDKATKKALRSLAKIINFALLYGGTEYTIFENMKKQKPDITWDEAKTMVAKYWEGVPVFAEWCQKKQAIAREKMSCTTSTGRVIDFTSAMEALGIRKPTEEETNNYWEYRRLVKKEEEAKKAGQDELAAKCKAVYDRLWKDQSTGVRNYKDYNQFMGKIQRVAVNVPLQGLAGDFMRISLNRIRAWVLKDPAIMSIFRLHCSVHDEIDFVVKNEYAPFMIPRITRLMKLRKYHEKMGWRVPIECDCEYGPSWDVENHLTGDDGHKPAGWTRVAGMETYLPDNFDVETIKNLLNAIASGEEARMAKAKAWLQQELHPRAFEAAKVIFEFKDRAEIKEHLIAALQLDEYWRIDEIPDDAEDTLETLEQYEKRNGLTVTDRGPVPEFGYLGAIPFTAAVNRPTLSILGEDVPAEDVEIIVSASEIRAEASVDSAPVVAACEDCHPDHECPGPDAFKQAAAEDDVIGVAPPVRKPKAVKAVEKVAEPPKTDGVPELRDMDRDELKQFRVSLGVGRNKVTVRYQGRVFDISDVAVVKVPDQYLKQVVSV